MVVWVIRRARHLSFHAIAAGADCRRLQSETELPKSLFPARRLAVLMADGASSDVGKPTLEGRGVSELGRQGRSDTGASKWGDCPRTTPDRRASDAGQVPHQEAEDYDCAIERYRSGACCSCRRSQRRRSITSPMLSQDTRTNRRRPC